MPKIILSVALIACLSAPFGKIPYMGEVFPEPEGLVLIACTADGFVLASDGASANADGTLSETQKIFPVGKYGAIALAGTTANPGPGGQTGS